MSNGHEVTDNVIPLRPGNPATEPERFPVEVSFGPASREFEFSRGDTAKTILENGLIKELIGFRGGELLTRNGQPITVNDFLNPGDRIEFIKEADIKA
jgi:hypothetical protein